MGFGITLYPQIYFNKRNYKYKYEVEDEINTIKNIIRDLENHLLTLIMTTEPSKMMPENWEGSPMEWLLYEYRKITDGYEDSLKGYYYDLWELELLLENWDYCHDKDGKAIIPPEGVFNDSITAYIDGDFING